MIASLTLVARHAASYRHAFDRKQGRQPATWPYDVAAIGYPGSVVHGRPMREPCNLGKGWVGFDYAKGLGCLVKVINDAAMQAVGSYKGGRMLFSDSAPDSVRR